MPWSFVVPEPLTKTVSYQTDRIDDDGNFSTYGNGWRNNGGFGAECGEYRRFIASFRFRNVDIPQGSIIKEARLLAYAGNHSADPNMPTARIQFENTDDAESYQGGNIYQQEDDAISRPRTQVYHDYLLNQDFLSIYEVTGSVQEVISREGWTSLNKMNVFIEPLGAEAGRVGYNIYDATQRMILRIEYYL